jgi:RND family efflux transporter MFP subunit
MTTVGRLGLILWAGVASGLPDAAAQTSAPDRAIDCVVQPRATVKLGSLEPGVITKLSVDRGDFVTQGQIVAHLDSGLQRLAVDLAKTRAESDVEIRSARARLEFRKLDFERAGQLHERQAMPARKLQEAEIEKQLAELALESALLQQRIAQAELAQARERLQRRVIRSSVDGVVVKLDVRQGEYVYEQVSVMTIAAIDPLHVEVFAPLSLFGRLSMGTEADVELEAPIGSTHRATVSAIDHVHDPASRTFGVRLTLPNPARRLPGGLNCRVRFLVADTPPDLRPGKPD